MVVLQGSLNSIQQIPESVLKRRYNNKNRLQSDSYTLKTELTTSNNGNY